MYLKAIYLLCIILMAFQPTEAGTFQTAKLFVNVSGSLVKKIPETFMGVFFEVSEIHYI